MGQKSLQPRRLPSHVPCVGLLGIGFLIVACGGTAQQSGKPPVDSGVAQNADHRDAKPPVDSRITRDVDGNALRADARRGGEGAADSNRVAEVPVNHRPDDSECSAPAPAGNCGVGTGSPDGGFGCTSDGECTQGANGRCNRPFPFLQGCQCDYDSCAHDTDCPGTNLCVCHESAYTNRSGNECLPGNCRADTECGANGYCSPSAGSQDPNTCGGAVVGYFCHTAADRCVNDTDCTGLYAACEWSSTDVRWECQMTTPCG